MKKILLSIILIVSIAVVSGCSISFNNQARINAPENVGMLDNQQPSEPTQDAPAASSSEASAISTSAATATGTAALFASGHLTAETRDSDQDGLSDLNEILYHTDKDKPDTDGDGYLDGQEVASGFNPAGSGPLVATSFSLAEKTRALVEAANDEEIGYWAKAVDSEYVVTDIAAARQMIIVKLGALPDTAPRGRDAKRLADIRQIQTAVEMYYNSVGKYPPDLSAITGPDVPGGPYLPTIPNYPLPADGVCLEQQRTTYDYTVASNSQDYKIEFCLGGQVDSLAAGFHTATSAGIK